MLKSSATTGGIIMTFADGTDSCCTRAPVLADQNGELILRSATVNQWDYRVVSLTPDAGKKISQVRLSIDGTTQPGQWDIYFQDLVYVSSDGSVWQIFSQNPVPPAVSGFGSTGMTLTSATIHDCSGSGCATTNTTTYFHGDQIGSARLLSGGYGYPIWQGTFTPFGQEVSPELTTNHYKFNGKERGEASEGSLDYYGARSYSSLLGRWMMPDWSDGPVPVPYAQPDNPQSLNLYSYVLDDPLSRTDIGGHFQHSVAKQPCPNSNGDACPLSVVMTASYRCSIGQTTFCQQAAEEEFNKACTYTTACRLGDKVHKLNAKIDKALARWYEALENVLYLLQPCHDATISCGIAFPVGGMGAAADSAETVSQGTKVFRVWGDQSGAWGKSWMTVDPRTLSGYRNAAGLPIQNTGRFLSEGVLDGTEGVTIKWASPLHGNTGGLPEIVVPNPELQIKLQNVQGLNPPF